LRAGRLEDILQKNLTTVEDELQAIKNAMAKHARDSKHTQKAQVAALCKLFEDNFHREEKDWILEI
jgi:hypothetical protein